jgi:hypothetical protein
MAMKKTRNPPDTEFILIFLGGLFVVADSVIGPALGFGSSILSQFFEPFGLIVGLLMIVCAILIYQSEGRMIKMWGVAALIFSLLSLVAGGGLLTGFVLGLLGSIFVLRRKY